MSIPKSLTQTPTLTHPLASTLHYCVYFFSYLFPALRPTLPPPTTVLCSINLSIRPVDYIQDYRLRTISFHPSAPQPHLALLLFLSLHRSSIHPHLTSSLSPMCRQNIHYLPLCSFLPASPDLTHTTFTPHPPTPSSLPFSSSFSACMSSCHGSLSSSSPHLSFCRSPPPSSLRCSPTALPSQHSPSFGKIIIETMMLNQSWFSTMINLPLSGKQIYHLKSHATSRTGTCTWVTSTDMWAQMH